MKTVYIDSDFKCHVSDDGTMTAVETSAFDGKCDTYIEGYRFVPAGETWIRNDGTVFHGEMIVPWKSWSELDKAQLNFERKQYAQIQVENSELVENIASIIEEVYQSDMEMMGL